jgi:endonuclease-3
MPSKPARSGRESNARRAVRVPKAGKPSKAARPSKVPRPAERRIAEIFRRFAAANPNPKGELEYRNPFTLLVAVVLSAQATDASVNKATQELFKIADTPRKMLALGVDGLEQRIKAIGLYRTKARNVIGLCERLIANHGGEVPSDSAALEALPGVGRKTANVVLNTAFGQATLAVDTHVFRVAHRLGLATGKSPEEVERELMRSIPPVYLQHAHHWLILHGRYVCQARKPKCDVCIVSDLCTAEEKWFHGVPPPVTQAQKVNP